MGHILFAAPGIRRFHLHERLARELRSRNHRVTVLCADPVEFAFWSAQAMAAVLVQPGRAEPTNAPLRELAELDCLLAGQAPGGGRLRREARRLARLLPMCLRWFEADPPDLVVLHRRRGSTQALLHYLARECGCRVLWTGDGVLPHTLQIDSEGIDGDAAAARRSAFDYRVVRPDRRLLDAALAALLARTVPMPLTRKQVMVPPLGERLRLAMGALTLRHRRGVLGAIEGWRAARPPNVMQPPWRSNLPSRPFVTLLLQDSNDVRVQLDGREAPDCVAIAAATIAAAQRIEANMPVVAVLPAGGLLARDLGRLRRMPGLSLELASAGPDAAVTATAVVTVNHPLGVAAALSGTPLVHLGRALYGLQGVGVRGSTDTLAADLGAAAADDHPELRQRFLTWLLAHGHVWCSPDFPDHNGILGLVMEIESRLQERNPGGLRLRYRTGPAWPLAADS